MVGELTADGSGTSPPWFVMQRYDIRRPRLWDGMAGGGQRWENNHPRSRVASGMREKFIGSRICYSTGLVFHQVESLISIEGKLLVT